VPFQVYLFCATICSMDFLTEEQRQIRASDQEREEVIEHLKACADEGRLDVNELSDRVQTAIAAKTLGELQDLCVDLPDDPVASLVQLHQSAQDNIDLEAWHAHHVTERHKTRMTVAMAILLYLLLAPLATATMMAREFTPIFIISVCFFVIYMKRRR